MTKRTTSERRAFYLSALEDQRHLLRNALAGMGKGDQIEALHAATCSPAVFDLLDMNLRARWPRPVFMWPMPTAMTFDIVFRRVRIFAQIDFEAFFKLAELRGIRLVWSSKQSQLLKRLPRIPGASGGALLGATNSATQGKGILPVRAD